MIFAAGCTTIGNVTVGAVTSQRMEGGSMRQLPIRKTLSYSTYRRNREATR